MDDETAQKIFEFAKDTSLILFLLGSGTVLVSALVLGVWSKTRPIPLVSWRLTGIALSLTALGLATRLTSIPKFIASTAVLIAAILCADALRRVDQGE